MLAPRLTAEPRSGGELRSLRLAQSLASRCELTIIVVGPATDVGSLTRATGAHEVLWFPGCTGARGRLLAFSHRWPLAVARAWNAQARDHVRSAARTGSRLVIDFLDPAALVDEAQPLVVNLHNVESDLASLENLGHGWRRVEQRVERRRMRRWEDRVVRRPRATVVVPTLREADQLAAHAVVVANGTDIPASPAAVPVAGTVLFVGALDYAPNSDALAWWVTEIAPLLRDADVPALTVVGRGQDEFVRQHPQAQGLTFAGVVDDVSPWLANATITVVPVRHGGGTRIKLLEAFANGRAVVTTSKGAEGLPVVDREHAIVADSAGLFASAVAELWHDSAQRNRLAAAARKLSLDYDWQALGSAFADIVLGSGQPR